jgi:hypothetical protein
MVGHQAVGVYLATKYCLPFLKSIQVIQIVVISGKHHLPIMTALDNMMRTIAQD